MAERSKQTSPSNVSSTPSKPLPKCSDIVANWLTVYAETWPTQPMSELTILAYRESLAEVRQPMLLHKAFLRAMRGARGFRPDPGTVLEAYDTECELTPRRPALSEAEPKPLTKEEAQEWIRQLREQVKAAEAGRK